MDTTIGQPSEDVTSVSTCAPVAVTSLLNTQPIRRCVFGYIGMDGSPPGLDQDHNLRVKLVRGSVRGTGAVQQTELVELVESGLPLAHAVPGDPSRTHRPA